MAACRTVGTRHFTSRLAAAPSYATGWLSPRIQMLNCHRIYFEFIAISVVAAAGSHMRTNTHCVHPHRHRTGGNDAGMYRPWGHIFIPRVRITPRGEGDISSQRQKTYLTCLSKRLKGSVFRNVLVEEKFLLYEIHHMSVQVTYIYIIICAIFGKSLNFFKCSFIFMEYLPYNKTLFKWSKMYQWRFNLNGFNT